MKFDLKQLNLSAVTHSITVVAKASGYKPSEPSNAVNYVVGISFYIGTIGNPSVIYHAEPNMTWEQWCNSEYNTVGFKVVNGTVYNIDGSYYIDSVTATDTISNGASYYLFATPQEETYTITAGTYVFKETPDMSSYNKYIGRFSFVSNTIKYNEIRYLYGERIEYDDTGESEKNIEIYTISNGWLAEVYRTITVETDQIVSEEFYNWFIANAQPQIQAGTYVFNDLDNINIHYSQDIRQNLNFQCAGISYSYIGVYGQPFGIVYDNNQVFTGGWNGEAYRTIQIPENQLVSVEFYNWFTENAVKQETTYMLTAGSYKFKDVVDGDEVGEELNFISNGYSFTRMFSELAPGSLGYCIGYSQTRAYASGQGGWSYSNSNYQHVLLDHNQIVSKKFYEWFVYNTILQSGGAN